MQHPAKCQRENGRREEKEPEGINERPRDLGVIGGSAKCVALVVCVPAGAGKRANTGSQAEHAVGVPARGGMLARYAATSGANVFMEAASEAKAAPDPRGWPCFSGQPP